MKNIYRLLLISFLLSIFSIVSSAKAVPRELPTEHIIFIHGIGGNDQSFGVMPKAITKHLGHYEKNMNHISYFFKYPTENDALTTDDFAMALGKFIHQTLGEKIKPNDKISFVAHSQGGLVATIWYFHAVLEKSGYHSEYIKYLNSFVTLGTPFWGSKIASILHGAKIPNFIKQKISKTLGNRQLEEMALGSMTNIRFRKNVSQIQQNVFDVMLEKIRPLNIAGMAGLSDLLSQKTYGASEYLEKLTPYLFGDTHFESDTMVSIPSARFDSIYTHDERTNYEEASIDRSIRPLQSKFSPFLVVKTVHASPMADEIYDMAFLPEKCLEISPCDHPTYFYILRHLLKQHVPSFAQNVPKDELSGFSLSFRVDVDPKFNAENMEIKTELVSYESSPDYELVLESNKEVMSKYDFVHPFKTYIFERNYSGYIKYNKLIGPDFEKARWKGIKAWFLISAPLHKSKIVEVLIKPTFSSYAEVLLIRKLPEMRAL